MYSKRLRRIIDLLMLFARRKSVLQADIMKLNGSKSYRNNVRQLKVLKNSGFIQILRVEESQGRGKQVWEITSIDYLGLGNHIY